MVRGTSIGVVFEHSKRGGGEAINLNARNAGSDQRKKERELLGKRKDKTPLTNPPSWGGGGIDSCWRRGGPKYSIEYLKTDAEKARALRRPLQSGT